METPVGRFLNWYRRCLEEERLTRCNKGILSDHVWGDGRSVGIATKSWAPHKYFLNGRKKAWGYHWLEVFNAARHSWPVTNVFIVRTKPFGYAPGIDAAPEGMRL